MVFFVNLIVATGIMVAAGIAKVTGHLPGGLFFDSPDTKKENEDATKSDHHHD